VGDSAPIREQRAAGPGTARNCPGDESLASVNEKHGGRFLGKKKQIGCFVSVPQTPPGSLPVQVSLECNSFGKDLIVKKHVFLIAGLVFVLGASMVWAGSSSESHLPPGTAPTDTFVAIDSVGFSAFEPGWYQYPLLTITGVLEGQATATTESYYLVVRTEHQNLARASCERMALLLLDNPGAYKLVLTADPATSSPRFVYEWQLVRVTP
jgi:hypothetical protein